MFALLLIVPMGLADEPRVVPYLAVDGKEAEPAGVQLRGEPGRITVRFEASRDGTYSFGVAIEAPHVTALAPGMPRYEAAALSKPLVLRYPYDWTYRGHGNVLSRRPRLVMPGVQVGERLCLADTRELFSVTIERTDGGNVRALFLKHHIANDGGDVATTARPRRAGETDRMALVLFGSLADANRARFGAATKIKGRMTQVPYRGWTRDAFDEEQYRTVARRLSGVFDIVIVREVDIHGWLPPVFHERGLKVISYQYLGALRRESSQVTDALERGIGLKGANGKRYTAPRSPNGAWLLCDIRRPDVRDRFARNAVRAIEAGFDGVFLDGHPFWPDTTGRRGGHVPNATCSLAHARWQLLRQIRTAVRKANPRATLGVLGNQYYDTLGEADYIVKERMYFGWDTFHRQFDQRRTFVLQDLDVPYETGQAPFAAANVCYGVKGHSPISVQTSLHFLRRPTGFVYIGAGDFFPTRLDAWLDALVAVASQDDLYITRIEPATCRVHFSGRATMWADTPCVVHFSKAICATSDGGIGKHVHQTRRLQPEPKMRYHVSGDCPRAAERH